MSNTIIQIKSSNISGNVPSTLLKGELAINVEDGKLFYGNTSNITQEFVFGGNPSGLNGELQFNSFGSFGASANLRFDTTSKTLYVDNVITPTVNVNQSIVLIGSRTNAAFDLANTLASGSVDATARQIANSAGSYANSAFAKANNALANTTGTFNGDLSVTGSFKSLNSVGFEGGELFLNKPATDTTLVTGVTIDVYQNRLRIYETGGTNRGAYIDLANGTTATVGTNILAPGSSGDYANSAFAKANTASIDALSAGSYANSAFITANTALGYLNQNVKTTSQVQFDTVWAANNGNGFNFRVGDDAWIGDYNTANSIKIKGQQDSSNGYISFGSNNSTLGVAGAGQLTYGANTVWHAGNDGVGSGLDADLLDGLSGSEYSRISAESYANGAFTRANTANTNAATADQRAVTSGSYANSAFGVANTADQKAVSAGSYANSAFGVANTADQRAVTSGSYANSAYQTANSAGSYANSAFIAANTADQRAVTSGSYANSAFTAANTADQRAVTSGSYANSAFTAANTADQKAVSAGVYANAAFGVANTASVNATSAGSYANSAYARANTANLHSISAYAQANTANIHSISAYAQANTATTNAATADQRAVTSGSYANSAYTQANTANVNAISAGSYANTAYARANTANLHSISAYAHANASFEYANTRYGASGGTISGDVSISGNLTVLGNVTSYSSENLVVNDPIILLANNNSSNIVDIGFVGKYFENGNTLQTGLVKDVSGNTYYLFDNYQPDIQITNTIDPANTSFKLANLSANIVTNVITIRGYDPINHTNSAYTQANTGVTNAASASSYANSAYARANTANLHSISAYAQANTATNNAATADQRAVTSGVYANAAYAQANTANLHSISAYAQANTATNNAATADQRAVTSGSYANSAFGVANTASINATSAGSYANSAYTQANTANVNAISAGSYANSAYAKANTIPTQVNATDDNTTALLYPIMVGAAGSTQTIKASTSKIYFNAATGTIYASSKSFSIPHPLDDSKRLVYGSLEGPENGVYVRGRLVNECVIQLPDYWTKLVDENTITVSLTPIGKFQQLYTLAVKDNKVYIANETKEPINCFYLVHGERKDVDKLQVEV